MKRAAWAEYGRQMWLLGISTNKLLHTWCIHEFTQHTCLLTNGEKERGRKRTKERQQMRANRQKEIREIDIKVFDWYVIFSYVGYHTHKLANGNSLITVYNKG